MEKCGKYPGCQNILCILNNNKYCVKCTCENKQCSNISVYDGLCNNCHNTIKCEKCDSKKMVKSKYCNSHTCENCYNFNNTYSDYCDKCVCESHCSNKKKSRI